MELSCTFRLQGRRGKRGRKGTKGEKGEQVKQFRISPKIVSQNVTVNFHLAFRPVVFGMRKV